MTFRSFARAFVVPSIAVLATLASGCLPGRAYDPCSVNADCPATTSCQLITAMGDRMCTTSCNSTSDCPLDRFGSSARCLSFNGGDSFSCWQACAAGGSGSECPFGYDCFTSDGSGATFDPICLPDRGSAPFCGDGLCNGGESCSSCATDCGSCVTPTQQAYENCSVSGQCLGSLACISVNSVGMCSANCTDALDCPLDFSGSSARCISFGGSAFTCFQACNISAGGAECAAGWGCYDNDGTSSFPPICLPN